jgi:regulator of nonsense transcripts 1
MESFDNYRDSASQYGASGLTDDTVSMLSGYTTNTQNLPQLELDSLSLSGNKDVSISGHAQGTQSQALSGSKVLDEDFDGVLDDLKDDGGVDLPPHACR